MSNYEKYHVDAKRFKQIIKKRGMSTASVSEDIGHGKNYISNSLYQGYFNRPTVTALEKICGIKPEDYAPISDIPVMAAEPVYKPDNEDLKKVVVILSEMCRTLNAIAAELNVKWL